MEQDIPRKLTVRITKSHGWAKKGEIHQVGNYVTFGYDGGAPHYEKGRHSMGVALSDCEIVTTYTMEELEHIVGHPFIIIN